MFEQVYICAYSVFQGPFKYLTVWLNSKPCEPDTLERLHKFSASLNFSPVPLCKCYRLECTCCCWEPRSSREKWISVSTLYSSLFIRFLHLVQTNRCPGEQPCIKQRFPRRGYVFGYQKLQCGWFHDIRTKYCYTMTKGKKRDPCLGWLAMVLHFSQLKRPKSLHITTKLEVQLMFLLPGASGILI